MKNTSARIRQRVDDGFANDSGFFPPQTNNFQTIFVRRGATIVVIIIVAKPASFAREKPRRRCTPNTRGRKNYIE